MTLFDTSELEPVLEPVLDPVPETAAGPAATGTATDPRDAEPRETAEAIDGLPEVVVRVSSRRRKTSEARWVEGRIIVSVPAHLEGAARQQTIDWLVQRLLTRYPPNPDRSDEVLLARAIDLSERYLVGVRPTTVRWVTNQTARWGSCSYYTGEIRISHRLRAVPDWVLDSVLVHELAHLTYPDHSPAFHRLANTYRRHEEAEVFLAGYELGLSRPLG
jgi:hypothetical protein